LNVCRGGTTWYCANLYQGSVSLEFTSLKYHRACFRKDFPVQIWATALLSYRNTVRCGWGPLCALRLINFFGFCIIGGIKCWTYMAIKLATNNRSLSSRTDPLRKGIKSSFFYGINTVVSIAQITVLK